MTEQERADYDAKQQAAILDSLAYIAASVKEREGRGGSGRELDMWQSRERLALVTEAAQHTGIPQADIDAAIARGQVMKLPSYVDLLPNPHRYWRITNMRTREVREIENPSWLEAVWQCQWDASECRIEGPRGRSFAEMDAAWTVVDDSPDGYWTRLDERDEADDVELECRQREEASLAV